MLPVLHTVFLYVFLLLALVGTSFAVVNIVMAARKKAERAKYVRLAIYSMLGTVVAALLGAYFRSRSKMYMTQDMLDDFVGDTFPDTVRPNGGMQTVLM